MNDYELAMEGMSALLSEHEKYIASFSRASYSKNFMEYYRSVVPALDAVEKLYLSVKEPDTMLGNMASAVARSARQILEESPKRKKEQVNINLSLMMAGYVFPALLQYTRKVSTENGAISRPRPARNWAGATTVMS